MKIEFHETTLWCFEVNVVGAHSSQYRTCPKHTDNDVRANKTQLMLYVYTKDS